MIEIVGTALNQWDTGRVVHITGIEAEYAHFANKGDSKAVIMGVVDIEVKIPDYLLQTGKQLCVYAVKDGITLESKTFSVRNRERPENYVYEDDQRNYIYELITSAENAIEGAIQAVEEANLALENANTAAGKVNAATENAVKSAASASEAAKNANEAAAKAAHTAKSLMVVGGTEGENIVLDDAIEQYLVGLRIFGKSTQDGKPTPDAPVDIVSFGDGGSITVSVTGEHDANSSIIATPSGLPGLAVASGGNHTDANGQRWLCDEIDFARGVYVHRVRVLKLNGSEQWFEYKYEPQYYGFFAENLLGETHNRTPGLCNQLSVGTLRDNSAWVGVGNTAFYAITSVWHNKGLSAWKAHLSENPLHVIYPLSVPYETPLSEEQLAAFADLHTYRGNTTVSNDAGAWMDLEYVMDAKKYIDRLSISGGGGGSAPARLASVTLLASKWVGSGSLYSQVVSIAGITENSQVNLAPSVEQLSVFYDKDITFVTENDGGVVTVYVIGQKPQNDYTIQADIVEVIV